MKKFILISSMFVFFLSLELKPYTVSVLVPRDVVSNGTLFVYMHDKHGAELVGKYTLSAHQGLIHSIAQKELELTTSYAHDNELVLEIVASNNQAESSSYVVVSLELDETVKVLKVLVVKDNFFEEDPFDVFSISAYESDEMKHFCEEMTVDTISDLSNNVADLDISVQSSKVHELTYYQKMMVMIKVSALILYGKTQRMLSSLYSRWS